MFKTLYITLLQSGINVKTAFKAMKGIMPFFSDKRKIKQQAKGTDWVFGQSLPCLSDRFEEGGMASGHYFHQDLWVAQLVFANNPVKHVDIGSRIDGFVSHVAAFRKIEVIDIRPVTSTVDNISFSVADLMQENDSIANSCDSISCLHALEHFGLGRYGDTVDINGHRKGFKNMARMLTSNGRFYFSTPISNKRRIEFNGQRVFDIPYLMEMFKDEFTVESFHYVDDLGQIHKNVPLTDELQRNSLNLNYGCGIFVLVKN